MECLRRRRQVDRTFGCDVNNVLHQMVSSFIAPPGIPHFVGAMTELIVAGNLGPWGALQPGGCRMGDLSSEDPSALLLPGCAAPYEGTTCLGLALHEPNYGGNPRRAAGTEYQANVVQIRSTKSTGTTACAGCSQPATFLTTRVFVAQPAGALELTGGDCAHWRDVVVNCDGASRRLSWGEVKSLYR